MIIDGLLQTEDYARATHLAARHVVAPRAVDNWVAARMQRQQRLAGPDPLRLHTVLAEAVLRLQVGGPAVMTAQLERLLAATSSENITIQILPATTWQHIGIASNLTVLHFADPVADHRWATSTGYSAGT